jgi:hypothetical protein
MKKQAWTGVIAATVCTFAIGLSAQSTSSSTSSTSRQSSSTAADHITVTGCLQRDTMGSPAGATGTSGSTSASTSASGFVLNVSPSSSSTGSTAGGTTAGGTTAGTSGTSASSYKLDSDDAKLSPHVGHKVEITGTLDKAMSSSSSTAPSGSTSSASSSMSPKLKVDSVRMIASSCSN